MTCLIVDDAVSFGEAELLVEVEKSCDALSVATDGVVTAAHKDDLHITLNTLDPRRGAGVLCQFDHVAVVGGGTHEAREGVVYVKPDHGVVSRKPVVSRAVRDRRETLVVVHETCEVGRVVGFALKDAHKSCHKASEEALRRRKIRSSAEDADIRIVAGLDRVLSDDRSEALSEQDELSAAVVVVNICEDVYRVRYKELVSASFFDAPEQLEFDVAAVTAEVVHICVKAVFIQEVDELGVALAVIRRIMNDHHTAERLFGCGEGHFETDFGLVLCDDVDGAFVHV